MPDKRRPGDPNPVPDTTRLDQMANVNMYGSPPGGAAGSGQPVSIVSWVFAFLDWRKQRRAGRRLSP
jgi:hypothetical protein